MQTQLRDVNPVNQYPTGSGLYQPVKEKLTTNQNTGQDSPEESKSEGALASACASNNANSFSSLSNITQIEGKAVPTVAHLNCGGNLSQDQVKSLPISSAVVLKLDLALPTEEIETIAPII